MIYKRDKTLIRFNWAN